MTDKKQNYEKSTDTAITYDTLLATVLPCPFCGEKPRFEKSYVPTEIEFMCVNDNCHVQPHLSVKVHCIENDGDTKTYSPQFEQHYKELLEKWNSRY